MYGIPGMMGHFYFNPRSLTGATSSYQLLFLLFKFQSTLPHGSDLRRYLDYHDNSNFNPRSLTGATQHRYQWAVDDMQFQSTLPHGSDVI